jgi:hypothetical protein
VEIHTHYLKKLFFVSLGFERKAAWEESIWETAGRRGFQLGFWRISYHVTVVRSRKDQNAPSIFDTFVLCFGDVLKGFFAFLFFFLNFLLDVFWVDSWA